MNQRGLVEQAQRGDHEAFARLAGPSLGRLEAVARLILRDRELAQDAVQEAYLKAWRDLRSLRDADRFDAWLRRLTVNACLDLARRRRRRPIEVDIDPILPADAPDLGLSLGTRDMLERAFMRLDPNQRAVIVLHFYADLPISAVAETLSIPLGTAQSRLGRALVALRAAISASDPEVLRTVQRGQPA